MMEPTSLEIRNRIDLIKNPQRKIALRFQYLTASRLSEVCGKYAFNAEEYEETMLFSEPVALFNIHIAKRKWEEQRVCALPLDARYEPWTKTIADHIKKKSGRVFSFSYKTLEREAAKVFNGLHYRIEGYQDVAPHWREVNTHALRHLRAKELLDDYDFSGAELATFGGWSLASVMVIPSIVNRYGRLQWREYFPKLLKPRA